MWTGHSYGHVWSLQWHGLVGRMCSSVEMDLWCSVEMELWVLCVPQWKWTCESYVFLSGSGLVGPVSSSMEVDLWVPHVLCSSTDVDLWVLYKWLWKWPIVGFLLDKLEGPLLPY